MKRHCRATEGRNKQQVARKGQISSLLPPASLHPAPSINRKSASKGETSICIISAPMSQRQVQQSGWEPRDNCVITEASLHQEGHNDWSNSPEESGLLVKRWMVAVQSKETWELRKTGNRCLRESIEDRYLSRCLKRRQKYLNFKFKRFA